MARPKKDGVYFSCYLRKDIFTMLSNYSERTGIPKTFLVEKALEDYLLTETIKKQTNKQSFQ